MGVRSKSGREAWSSAALPLILSRQQQLSEGISAPGDFEVLFKSPGNAPAYKDGFGKVVLCLWKLVLAGFAAFSHASLERLQTFFRPAMHVVLYA